jgi:hypothetical protein
MNIRYVPYRNIDKQKWDKCLCASPNGLIYARAFYLDAMTGGRWDALVLGDYEAVMPLPWNRKWGINYLYQPYFTPVLGIFGSNKNKCEPFLQAIPKKFRYWDICLNEANHPEANHPETRTATEQAEQVEQSEQPEQSQTLKSRRTNYILPLNRPYDDLNADYKRLARRMCRKALEDGLLIARQVNPKEVIGLYRKEYGRRHKIEDNHYDRLTKCADKAMESGNAKTYLARWPDGGIGAFYLVFSDDRFVYSVLGGSTKKGKETGAFYLLTDAALQDHADTKRTFRFEGSDIEGIAFFDAQFGAVRTAYPHLVLNNLPYPFKWLKR